ncbi:MAG: NCS2 family permease [Ruminococcus sp.]|nr:NCS2 family permease [uncultured Ruminococcus sp.]MBQ1349219.1 NCS2 family permease [Ruminococcus sp.]MBQ2469673.1 NCS2 family permease [Ruminococcus sp.]SCX18876.1 putative MFS transporter, AGZA family, xanthine/uracil permease [Ruminococcaceae bacterium P7]
MEKLFKLKENGTTVRTEIVAGITTFLAMAYILAVNPNILSAAGMPNDAIFAATAISAAFATLIMAFFANYPVVLASGMGLNAYFAFSVVPQLAEQGITDPWRVALTAILFEGVIFIILSIFKFRETLVNKVPKNLKLGISAGIGLFIAIVGLKGANITVDDPSTLVTLGDVGSPQVVLAVLGLLIIAALWHFKVKGAILIGIVATWIFGMIAQVTGWYQVDPAASAFSVIPDFSNYTVFAPVQSMATTTFFKFDFAYVASNAVNFAVIVFAFLFVDLFDTVGTLIGVAQEGGLLDKNGELPKVGRALMADAVGTVGGAMLGTSTVTSYVESTTGVAEGGKTGLTALTSAVLFLLALPLYPIFLAIPSFATTPALVFVGLLMVKNVTKMDFDSDIADTLGGFFAIIMMPFTYSIANGIMFGIIAWVILKVVTGKIKDIHPVMWVSFVLFAVRIVTIIMGVSS